jgi:hypothetical protein
MAEDTKEEKVPLQDPAAALASLKRAQEKGTWPQREPLPRPTSSAQNTKENTYDSAKKIFPTKETQEKVLSAIPGEETIPPDIKQELTETTKKLNTIAMEGSDLKSERPQEQPQPPYGPPTAEQAQARQEGVDRFKTILRTQENPSEFTPPPATAKPEKPPTPSVTIPSQEVAPAAAPWIKKEQGRMTQGTQATAIKQTGPLPEGKAPLPTSEQVAAQQSIAQGQEIKKRWIDRIPFLKIIGGKK